MSNHSELFAQAKAVLYRNKGSNPFTIPTSKLYPFQWNWDSGFTALGYMHFDLDAALEEIETLLTGQWANGMIPHILFHSQEEKTYFPNWDFWKAEVNAGVPQSVKTSGITQPPVLGFVLEKIVDKFPDHPEVLAFAKKAFPKMVNYQRFWYNYRDPYKEGLVFIFHPWESGRDNSPIWDDALELIDLEKADIPSYTRRDTSLMDSSERPTSRNYDQYVYLLLLGQKHGYDGPGIAEESEFLIQDTLINALLIKSNESLIRVGKILGEDTGELQEWQQQSIKAFDEKLWNPNVNNYVGYDLRQQKQMPFWEIGGLTALYAGIPSTERASSIRQYLQKMVDDDFLITPSFDVYHELYDSKRYWRGPIWPQMNWLVYQGLKRYGFKELAALNRQNFIDLVEQFGFYEYFEAQKKVVAKGQGGYGGDHFSWTASSIIDFIR